jgi:hypothetical protein
VQLPTSLTAAQRAHFEALQQLDSDTQKTTAS